MQVDLAGSERIKESGSEGVRLTEAQVLFSKQSNWFEPILLIFHSGDQQEPFKSRPGHHGAVSEGRFQHNLPKKRTLIFPFSGVPRSIPELEADPPAAKQPGRQLKDLDVRQHQSQGGVLRGDAQLPQIRHQSEPMQYWHCHQED